MDHEHFGVDGSRGSYDQDEKKLIGIMTGIVVMVAPVGQCTGHSFFIVVLEVVQPLGDHR